jgi:lipopolysaccharide/colanic/teichoic acid biosynthesis glycosyltransferase
MNLSPYGLNRIKLRRILLNLVIDIIAILMGTLLILILRQDQNKLVFNFKSIPFISFFLIMIITAFLLKKYEIQKRNTYYLMLNRFLFAWIISSGVLLAGIFYFNLENVFSIKVLLFWLSLIFIFEFILYSISYAIRYTRQLKAQREDIHISSVMSVMQHENENPDEASINLILNTQIPDHKLKISDELFILENAQVRTFIHKHTFADNNKRLFLCTTNPFNIETSPDLSLTQIINVQKINPIFKLNKFFEAVYTKLLRGGIFILCVETIEQRRTRLSKKYHVPLKFIIRFFDFLVHRIWSQLPYMRALYLLIWKQSNRRLSYTETLGRLYSCGFELVSEIEAEGKIWLAMRKTTQPVLDSETNYGPIIKLKRIGQDGKEFFAYKFRTMYPYSEYLQEFIYNKNSLYPSGKFKDDFRITPAGKYLRRFWIDEIPMLINFFGGQLKIFGVRPLSKHYFNLYPENLRQLRIKYKPGLIPPYYSDMPSSLDEIFNSEIRYLEAYSANKFKTNFKYFIKAIYNILFKKARSM